ncbi:ATP-grasp domain-containing protein [Roseateles sp. BYS87W]|uniref:ATP-grasp domain-containing protein n=1 Tax=Pelomonas baiyunensis TaxID=3299026 RepID=A0ABW7GXB6_9BURK
MSNRPATFLITAAGTGTAWGYALALAQQFPHVRLITADTNEQPWCTAAQLASTHVRWPLFQAGPAYLQQLQALVEAEGVTHYLPIIDPEIHFAAEHRHQINATVLAPHAGFTALALAKDRYADALAAWEIDSPRTLTVDAAAARLARGQRVFAKQPGSFGGRGTWEVAEPSMLCTLPAGAFLQEGLAGPEFTADCFPLGGGNVFVSVRERMETKSGVCTKARIAPHAGMEALAQALVRATGVETPFCFQAMADGDRLAVTDINPRLGAGTAMSAANGSDFHGAHLAQQLGDAQWQQRLQRHHARCAVTRQYFEMLSPL